MVRLSVVLAVALLAVVACDGDGDNDGGTGPNTSEGFTARALAAGGQTTCTLQDGFALHCWGNFSSSHVQAAPDTINCSHNAGCYLRPTLVDSTFLVSSFGVGGRWFHGSCVRRRGRRHDKLYRQLQGAAGSHHHSRG